MSHPTLEELCVDGGDQTPARKEYTHYERTITTVSDPVVLLINLGHLSSALTGDPVWAPSLDERSPETFVPTKYNRSRKAVSDEKPIYMPWLSFRKGRTHLTDGRHRLYALIDEGYTHAKVVVDPWHADALRSLVDKEDGGTSDDGFVEWQRATLGPA